MTSQPNESPDLPPWTRLCRHLLLGSWLVCLLTALLVPCTNAEVTPFAGPVIFSLGLIMIAIGLRRRVWLVVWAGLGHCGICGVFVGLVWIAHLGPTQAVPPFLLLGMAYCVLTGIYMVRARKRLPLWQPWQCRRCGYPLIGLSKPRCPECGQPFPSAQLASLVPPAATESPDPRD